MSLTLLLLLAAWLHPSVKRLGRTVLAELVLAELVLAELALAELVLAELCWQNWLG